jgi:hypothetical protein
MMTVSKEGPARKGRFLHVSREALTLAHFSTSLRKAPEKQLCPGSLKVPIFDYGKRQGGLTWICDEFILKYDTKTNQLVKNEDLPVS